MNRFLVFVLILFLLCPVAEKRVPCSNAMTRHLRTVYATVPYGFKKELRSSLFSSTSQPLSLV